MSLDWHEYIDESEIIHLIPDSIEYTLTGGKNVTAPLKQGGRVITKHLPVEVPLKYCKNKEIDAGAEALQCLGYGCNISGKSFRPPVIGAFSLMEITNNPFPVNPESCTDMQLYHVLVFLEMRAAALPLVHDWYSFWDGRDAAYDLEDESTWTDLDIVAMNLVDNLLKQGVDVSDPEFWKKLLNMVNVCNGGFEMLPGSGSGSKYWYLGETIASLAATIGADLQIPIDELIWNTPLALIGFMHVSKSKMNGVNGVSRPKDTEDVRRQMILAFLREEHGELHPWQIRDPMRHNLTPRQEKHKNCVKRFDELRKTTK